jgi:ribosomal 50S subunit-recycling heat shock protein
VKVGDVVEVTFGQRTLVFRVKEVKEHVLKDGAEELYEVISQ